MHRLRSFALVGALVAAACAAYLAETSPSLAAAASGQGAPRDFSFVENRGQWPPDVLYVAEVRGTPFVLRNCALELELPPESFRLTFAGCQPSHSTRGLHPGGQSNYYIGQPDQWVEGARHFREVVFEKVYPGVDAVFKASVAGLPEFDFVFAPGTDPAAVRLHASHPTVLHEGTIKADVGGKPITLALPRAFQPTPRAEMDVSADFVLSGDGTLGFRVGPFDPFHELIIDPVVDFSTYFGGGRKDHIDAVAVDAEGNTIIAGDTESGGIPLKNPVQGWVGSFPGLEPVDAFVTKFDPTGQHLVYSTYLGGDGWDEFTGVAVDSEGSAYLAAWVRAQWMQPFPVKNAPAGQTGDFFVVKLDRNGSLVYSVPVSWGKPEAIAVDSAQKSYVVGITWDPGFHLVNPVRSTISSSEAFLTKLSANGTILYSTFLGGSDRDLAKGVTVDKWGSPYVVGSTLSPDFLLANASQPVFGGGNEAWLDSIYVSGDAFVVKLNPSGKSIRYATYLGGSAPDQAHGVTVDDAGNAYLAGATFSTDFPVAGALQERRGATDAFLASFDAGGKLRFSTPLGGEADDQAFGLALDPDGIQVAGWTSSSDFPGWTFDQPFEGVEDAFVTMVTPRVPERVVSTYYLGGKLPIMFEEKERAMAVAVGPGGRVHVAGLAESFDFPVKDAFQPEYWGSYFFTDPDNPSMGDGFLSVLLPCREVPCTTARPEGTLGGAGWWRSNVTVQLRGECVCDATTLARVDDAPWNPVQAVRVTGDGTHLVRYRSTSSDGAEEAEHALLVPIDTTLPMVDIQFPDGAIVLLGTDLEARVGIGALDVRTPTVVVGNTTVVAAAFDQTSGVKRVDFLVDGLLASSDAEAPYEFFWEAGRLPLGNHSLEVRAWDVAGNGPAVDILEVWTAPTGPTGGRATCGTVAQASPVCRLLPVQ